MVYCAHHPNYQRTFGRIGKRRQYSHSVDLLLYLDPSDQASWLGVLFMSVGIAVFFRKYTSTHTFLLVWFVSGYIFPDAHRLQVAALFHCTSRTAGADGECRVRVREIQFFDAAVTPVYSLAASLLLLQYLLFTYVPAASASGIQLSETGIVRVAARRRRLEARGDPGSDRERFSAKGPQGSGAHRSGLYLL